MTDGMQGQVAINAAIGVSSGAANQQKKPIRGLNHTSYHECFEYETRLHTDCAGSLLSTDYASALHTVPPSLPAAGTIQP